MQQMLSRSAPLILLVASAGCTALAGVDEFTKVDGVDAAFGDAALEGGGEIDSSVIDSWVSLDGETGAPSEASLPDTSTPTDTFVPPVDTGPSVCRARAARRTTRRARVWWASPWTIRPST